MDKSLITHRHPHIQILPLKSLGDPQSRMEGHDCSRGKMLDRYSLGRDTKLESCQACFHLLPILRVPIPACPNPSWRRLAEREKCDPFDVRILFRFVLSEKVVCSSHFLSVSLGSHQRNNKKFQMFYCNTIQ